VGVAAGRPAAPGPPTARAGLTAVLPGGRGRALTGLGAALALSAAALSGCSGQQADAAPLSPGCSLEAAPAEGQDTLTVRQGAESRSFTLVLPEIADPAERLPLLLAFHGTSGQAESFLTQTGLGEAATGRGMAVLAPQAEGSPAAWAIPGVAGLDDVAFVETAIEQVGQLVCLDPDRVYATGISGGAAMAAYFACASEQVAAVAPVAGVGLLRVCPDGPPVSVLAFHGDMDPIAPFSVDAEYTALTAGSFYIGDVRDVVSGWGARESCKPQPKVEVLGDEALDYRWLDCRAGSDVQLVVLAGGGHTWPGSDPPSAEVESFVGATSQAVDATELMLDFFDAHPRVNA
jgi:polyhydroxybutyrate depolymerase